VVQPSRSKEEGVTMLNWISVSAAIFLLIFASNISAKEEQRLALLIGNSHYTQGGSLANPVNDVRAMRKALEGLGFTVMEYQDCTQKVMKRAMDKFGHELKGKDVGLFFYAGHGVQVNGLNYLLPVDARLENENDAEYDCVRADRVLAKMEAAGSRTNIVILDACRDNPFERSWRRGTKGAGLAFMNAPTGSLIAYSTAPGKTALDGQSENSPYTAALLQNIGTPNITVLQMFQRVRAAVRDQSGYKQTPWESTSLTGDFYFRKSKPIAVKTDHKQVNPMGKLYVQTNPVNATVTFLNHHKTFQQGMELVADHYEIVVAAEGYHSAKKRIRIEEGEDTSISVRLSRLINFVLDGNFADFGKPGGPWGTGAYSNYGIWWNSKNAKSNANKILLKPDNFLYKKYGIQTALYLSNKSPAAPHVFGTTAQKIKVTPNQKYTLTLWAASKDLSRTGAVNILVDPTWAKRLIYVKGGNTEWTKYSATFNTGDANYIDLRIISEDVGKVWLTGLSIFKANE
jgi:hypothetical protein